MIGLEEFFAYVLVGSITFGLGYACGTHATWLPAIGGKIGGLFKRKAPAAPQTATFHVGVIPDAASPSAGVQPDQPRAPTVIGPEVFASPVTVKSRPSWVKS